MTLSAATQGRRRVDGRGGAKAEQDRRLVLYRIEITQTDKDEGSCEGQAQCGAPSRTVGATLLTPRGRHNTDATAINQKARSICGDVRGTAGQRRLRHLLHHTERRGAA